MTTANTAKPMEGSRSRSQIIVLFIALIVFIMLLFANFAYLNTQSNYDKQYISHAGELRVLSQRIAKNATEAAAGKAAAFKLLGEARNDFAQRWGYLKKGDPATGLPAALLDQLLAQCLALRIARDREQATQTPTERNSAWRWRPACCTNRACCCSMNRPPALTPRPDATSGRRSTPWPPRG